LRGKGGALSEYGPLETINEKPYKAAVPRVGSKPIQPRSRFDEEVYESRIPFLVYSLDKLNQKGAKLLNQQLDGNGITSKKTEIIQVTLEQAREVAEELNKEFGREKQENNKDTVAAYRLQVVEHSATCYTQLALFYLRQRKLSLSLKNLKLAEQH
jgi:hypothetical protein